MEEVNFSGNEEKLVHWTVIDKNDEKKRKSFYVANGIFTNELLICMYTNVQIWPEVSKLT